MGSDTIQGGSASFDNVSSGEMETESNNIDSLEVVSSSGDITQELEGASASLAKIELDLACSSEKLDNLDILVMHVASREIDFEDFALDEEHTLEGSVEKALQFDLLYGFLDSEVRELDSFLSALQSDIGTCREVISPFKHLGNDFMEMEEKLHDCEESLKRSFEQLSDIKVQSANFWRILSTSSGDEKWKHEKELAGLENGDLSNLNPKIKMQTAEQQRHVLRMLEKSLAREMDLEKNLAESRQTEEDSKLRWQHEVLCMEEEAENIWERLFEAENSAQILLGISKELFGRFQVVQFKVNRSIQNEEELRSQCQGLDEQLKERVCSLLDSENSRTELLEKVNSLEQKLREFESQLPIVENSSEQNKELPSKIYDSERDELKEKVIEAEKRDESSKAECKLLRESNMELNSDLSRLKSSIGDAAERVEQLERQLKDSEVKRLHAEASYEASQEKQNMLDYTIVDMENLIKDLKLKVLKAENRAENVEEKCIILSESNIELIGEINFLRGRLECLETSLHQADEVKKETAKDVRMRTKFIADLVMQLAFERERLHKQISSLMKEKKVEVKHLQQKNEDSITMIRNHDTEVELVMLSNVNIKNGTSGKASDEKIMGSSATGYEIGNAPGDSVMSEIKMGHTVSTSKLDAVRNIEARQLNFKYVFMAVLVLAISAFAAFLLQQ